MLIKQIKNKLFSQDLHTQEVLVKTSASMLIRVLGMVIGLIVSIILGNKLGPEGLGLINLSEKIVSIVSVFSYLGLDNVVRKQVAISYDKKQWAEVNSTVYTAFCITIPLATIYALLLIVLSPWLCLNIFNDMNLLLPLLAALLMLVPQVASKIYVMAINGFRKVWQSSLFHETLTTLVVGGGLFLLLVQKIDITLIRVVELYIVGKAASYLAIMLYWKKTSKTSKPKRLLVGQMLQTGLPLMLVSATALVAASIDTIMLGWLSNVKDVGMYSIASRLALLTSFFHIISISSLSPKIASLYAQGEIKVLELMIQKITAVLGFIGLTSFLLFLFFGSPILSLWGEEFIKAHLVLVILSLGQCINIGTGATGVILMMTGHEKTLGKITILSAMLNIILNYIFIVHYGLIGAALATMISIVIQNILQIVMVRKSVNVNPLGYLFRMIKNAL